MRTSTRLTLASLIWATVWIRLSLLWADRWKPVSILSHLFGHSCLHLEWNDFLYLLIQDIVWIQSTSQVNHNSSLIASLIFPIDFWLVLLNIWAVFQRGQSGQTGQSGCGFEKPGSVQIILSPAAKTCRRPGNRRVERIGDPDKASRYPGKAARYHGNECCLCKTEHWWAGPFACNTF